LTLETVATLPDEPARLSLLTISLSHQGPQDPVETHTARGDSSGIKTTCAFEPGYNFADVRRGGYKAGYDSGAAGIKPCGLTPLARGISMQHTLS
jgi:hypothetical protein